jgi:hypothetical protein
MKAALFWIRWILVVPVFLGCWQFTPLFCLFILRLFGYEIHTDSQSAQPFFILALLTSFLNPLACTATAPKGKSLVAVITVFLNAMPGLFGVGMGLYLRRELVRSENYEDQGRDIFSQFLSCGAAFILGATLSAILIALVLKARQRRGLQVRGVAA